MGSFLPTHNSVAVHGELAGKLVSTPGTVLLIVGKALMHRAPDVNRAQLDAVVPALLAAIVDSPGAIAIRRLDGGPALCLAVAAVGEGCGRVVAVRGAVPPVPVDGLGAAVAEAAVAEGEFSPGRVLAPLEADSVAVGAHGCGYGDAGQGKNTNGECEMHCNAVCLWWFRRWPLRCSAGEKSLGY